MSGDGLDLYSSLELRLLKGGHQQDVKICFTLPSEGEQAQLKLCKLGLGMVLIFYKSLAPTLLYM